MAQLTPNRSVTMPKVLAQKAGAIGMVTVPPEASASKAPWASSVVSYCRASIMPFMPSKGMPGGTSPA